MRRKAIPNGAPFKSANKATMQRKKSEACGIIINKHMRKKHAYTALAISITIIFAVGVHRIFNHYDHVGVTIHGIRKGTDFVCLVADTASGPQAMEQGNRI